MPDYSSGLAFLANKPLDIYLVCNKYLVSNVTSSMLDMAMVLYLVLSLVQLVT